VVLSGCETAVSAPDSVTATVGLAQAFLARGAEHVIGTSRPVRDSHAATVMRVFYRHWTAGQPVADALRAAQLALRDADPQADWSAFRVMAR
jgi:CHAT domain-containing protein